MNVYEIVSAEITRLMENKKIVPWRMPWKNAVNQNLVSRKPYSGLNWFTLDLFGLEYQTPYWLTFKQAKDLGGYVKEGEKGAPVIFFKPLEVMREKANGEKTVDEVPVIRYYRVFNIAQCAGVPVPQEEFAVRKITPADEIVEKMPNRPVIQNGLKACYRPASDTVTVPPQNRFEKQEEYYSTLFHEFTHSTGHPSRLNRKGFSEDKHFLFEKENYSREELIAEMGSAFLCRHAGITTTLENSVSYLSGWLSFIKNDPKALITASSKAQKASRYIMGEVA